MNNIRQLTKDEYPKAIELSWQVFTITGKEDFNNEGLEFFKSFIYNKKCINEIIFYGSFDNEALTGILGIKSNGKHISLFFIKPEYHRHGLGKKLFHYASTLHPSIETTVNSSTYAIPFYQSLGFAVVGEKQNYHGLCSTPMRGSPDKSGGKFFNSIENLYLCAMNNQGLLALAQLILPSEILSNFEVVRVEEEASLIRIYLDESVKAEYKENPEIESKGFCEAVTIRDFPIRDKGVDLIVRRRKWYDKQNNRYFSDSYELKAEGTRYSKEFAAFLKGVYGDDSYDLPFA